MSLITIMIHPAGPSTLTRLTHTMASFQKQARRKSTCTETRKTANAGEQHMQVQESLIAYDHSVLQLPPDEPLLASKQIRNVHRRT